MRKLPGLSSSDRLLAVTTISFDIAGLELFLPLISGATVVLASTETAADGRLLRDAIEQHRITVMQATPSTWRMLVDSGWNGERPLKVLCGGEALPRDLANELAARSKSVWNVYGPTETTIWSAACRVTAGTGPVYLGRPIDNTQFYVLDKELRPVPLGVPGELCIGGTGLAAGYWNLPQLTAEKFVTVQSGPLGPTRFYRTGDEVRYTETGDLEYLGRLDHQLKL
jgi:non-ribosomal peptide synthetase component F